ncbi:MAG TPA: hypothetical protein PKD85_21380 [Saprospiraceae bacterium]|nr:hypothetical protein [Saprospiraceae bacterium]
MSKDLNAMSMNLKKKLEIFTSQMNSKLLNMKDEIAQTIDLQEHTLTIRNDDMYVPIMINLLSRCGIRAEPVGKQPYTKLSFLATPKVMEEIIEFANTFYATEINTTVNEVKIVLFDEISSVLNKVDVNNMR